MTLDKNILVLLGYSKSNSIHVLNIIFDIQEYLKKFNKVFIKLHPAGPYKKENLLKKRIMPDNFVFIDGKIEDYLEQVNLAICGETGAAITLVINCIPVAYVGNLRGITLNYFGDKINLGVWKMCFFADDVMEALEWFIKLQEKFPRRFFEGIAFDFKKHFFAGNEAKLENYSFGFCKYCKAPSNDEFCGFDCEYNFYHNIPRKIDAIDTMVKQTWIDKLIDKLVDYLSEDYWSKRARSTWH